MSRPLKICRRCLHPERECVCEARGLKPKIEADTRPLAEVVRETVLAAYRKHGSIRLAAAALGIGKTTMHDYLKRYRAEDAAVLAKAAELFDAKAAREVMEHARSAEGIPASARGLRIR